MRLTSKFFESERKIYRSEINGYLRERGRRRRRQCRGQRPGWGSPDQAPRALRVLTNEMSLFKVLTNEMTVFRVLTNEMRTFK